jgi:hypothetical protein
MSWAICHFTGLLPGLAEQIGRLVLPGAGNPPLTLVGNGLSFLSHSTVGCTGEHLQLVVMGMIVEHGGGGGGMTTGERGKKLETPAA